MANEKEMHPMSGDTVETPGVYQDNYGYEVELKAGEQFPMDPQLGKVDYVMTAFPLVDRQQEPNSDQEAAQQSNVPVNAVGEESPDAKQSRQLMHRNRNGIHN